MIETASVAVTDSNQQWGFSHHSSTGPPQEREMILTFELMGIGCVSIILLEVDVVKTARMFDRSWGYI